MQRARRSSAMAAGAWSGERRARAPGQAGLKCPRCSSPNTKFCYYNNYNLSQPRHFCKSCRRYWTNGGALRNVPVGGGSRKSRRTPAAKPSDELPSPVAAPGGGILRPPLPASVTATSLPSASPSDSAGFCPIGEEDKKEPEMVGPPALLRVQGQVADDGDLVGSEWPGGEAEFLELGAALEQSYCWEGQSQTLAQWPEFDQSLYLP